ncbi:NAD-dependent epimerase/dehydratase family protein [Mycobacterium sp. E740]|uniref:NAD-dependent epimerase/dehydratase family protein n=1 Tax=Mycobacterium sp. E740 TaxID=1834149 RepID=UPI0009ED1470|nr:NAD-dependent epimerase/dehydratase family protein [Mycobacterium sp. E740]
MEIFCTGATGFVGAHTALALLGRGHRLRLLVRDEARARHWFESHGHQIDRFVTADLNDRTAVERAMAGCDAVFHAAATVSLNRAEAEKTYANNVGAAKSVLDAADHLDIDNVVYVSSVTALFRPGLARIDEMTPLGDVSEAYSRSKRDGDAYVRGLQQRGLPVQITYPSGVVGPDDPKLSALNRAVKSFVCQALPRTSGGLQAVDVRDLAQAHLWLLEHPNTGDPEGARYIVGGHFYPWAELRRVLENLLGYRVFSPRVAPRLMRATGAAVDVVRRVVPFEAQISAESMVINTLLPPADSSRFVSKSGVTFRSGEDTFADTIRWLAGAGHVDLEGLRQCLDTYGVRHRQREFHRITSFRCGAPLRATSLPAFFAGM